ncbi:MAG TPA: NAD-dependent epimerase/dehydratase family protein [Solirubrobacteraceae bacterium]|jgi:nucleoside-diphosphate-sugar epimerase
MPPASNLTVAVTGPTGDIGKAFLRALDQEPRVGRVLGMARSPFDPASLGVRKTEYRQGDILDREAVDALVQDADVVVHLAFIIVGDLAETREVNLNGSSTVFEAVAKAAKPKRFVYTSSVAAYGFHADNPQPLTENVEPRGTESHYYSAQKAELENTLEQAFKGSGKDVYVFRPSIVAGPDAPALLEEIPYVQAADKLPSVLRTALGAVPLVKPVIPDPGVPFQLVHHDDVAQALLAAVLGNGKPGTYNLAGEGTITLSDLAKELGWYSVPVPDRAVDITADLVARLPLPAQAQWINAVREPVIMDTSRVRQALDWKPRHPADATLRETVSAARSSGLIG